jgi:hypothetical protein
MTRPNPARTRGSIESGRTRDSRPGLHRAAATLDTDAAAAGTRFTPGQIDIAPDYERWPPETADSFADAMRNPHAGAARVRKLPAS